MHTPANAYTAQPLPPASRLLRQLRVHWGLLLLGLLLGDFVWEIGRPVQQLDDAFISYRYARNLVAGHGLVYNIGEYVEGYTNLLWTLLVAAGLWLTNLQAPTIGRILSVICGAAGLLVAYGYTAGLLPRSRTSWSVLAPAAMLASTGFVRWHTSGLETPLFMLLVTAACWAQVASRPWLTASLCALATLTRPDGVLLAACLLAGPALAAVVMQRPRAARHLAAIAGPSVAFALFIAAFTLFRVAYYGDVLPNTFHAKVGQIGAARGILYTLTFLADGPFWLLPGAALAAWAVPRLRWALLYVAVNAAYVIDVGGDVFIFGRFLLPGLPILLVANLAAAGSLWPIRPARMALIAAPALCAAWALVAGAPAWSMDLHPFSTALQGSWWPSLNLRKRRLGFDHILPPADDAGTIARLQQMRRAVPGLHTLATIGVGRIGYDGMDIVVVDLVGLLDHHIARSHITVPDDPIFLPGHSRTDAAYVLARAPDIIDIPPPAGYIPPGATQPIVPLPEPGSPNRRGIRHIPAVMELWRNPGLQLNYAYNTSIEAWVRKPATK